MTDIEFAPELPAVESLLQFEAVEQFAAIDEPGAEPLVTATAGGVAIAAGSLAIVYGSGGAGKTTLVTDMVFAFAADRSWCDVLEPARALRIAIIENEGPRPMLRGKLREKIDTHGPVDGRIVVMTEPWSKFTFADETQRRELADAIVANEIDLLVVGPLSRVGMKGGGTLDEIDSFEKLLLDVRDRTDRQFAILIVHHESKSGAISGAWEGVPDTLIHVQGQGHGHTRVYWEKARWSSELHGTSTHLVWGEGATFTVTEKEQATEDTIAEDILEKVRENPGASWNTIDGLVTGNGTKKRKVRDSLLAAGRIENTETGKKFALWHPEDPLLEQVRPTPDAPEDAPLESSVSPGWEGVSVQGASVRPYVVEDAPWTDAPTGPENGLQLHVDRDNEGAPA